MIALLLAAQLATMPASMFGGATGAQAWQRGACGPSPVQKAAQQGAPVARKLGDLPKANHEIALMRTEGGCPKPVIVRYHVGR